MNNNEFIVDTMTWSFSRLNSFSKCPHEWHEVYIECQKGEDSFFGEFGACCHKVLEKYAKEEISIFNISHEYENEFFNTVVHDAPPNKYVDIKESYFNKGMDYFNNIDLDFDNYEILGIEKEIHFSIGDKDFIGFIDLLLKDKETGKIIILDHKSASIKILKNGNISKTDAEHFKEFKRQLYLYSIPIIEEYGKVDELWWNLFSIQNWIKIPFNKEEYKEAITWAKNTIKAIENETEFPCNPSYYYCNYLCSQRSNACEFKEVPINTNADNTDYNDYSLDKR